MSDEITQADSTIPDRKYHLKYDSMTAVFADHVVLNGTNGGMMLDFASSIINDPETGDATVPVHTRVAMTTNGAAQLYQLLHGVFTQATSESDTAGEGSTADAE